MLDRPGIQLRISASDKFSVESPDGFAPRIREFTARWAAWNEASREPCCSLEVVRAPRLHIGLGVGTQLGLAVAAGLNHLTGRPCPGVADLAASVGRGLRSAVGTYGFHQGGLILEEGKARYDRLSRLITRVPLPEQWRFVLITPQDGAGLSGRREVEAFGRLPPVPLAVTERLESEAHQSMIPAAREEQFDAFSQSVFRFGRLAGECFESIQGGPYNGEHLQQLVERILEAGFDGVGQTSWGPTIFVLARSQDSAEDLVAKLREWPELARADLEISAVNNRGATVSDS